MNTNIGNQRLLELADLLEKLPPERFNYNNWVGPNWAGRPDLSCGTQACALGWATTLPSLQKVGLKLVQEGCYSGVQLSDKRGTFSNLQAAALVFTLSYEEAYQLFMPAQGEWNATAKYVAAKIRNFVDLRDKS